MMGILNTNTKLSAIGLEYDAHEFRAVQLVSSSKRSQHEKNSVVAWAVFPRQHGVLSAGIANLPEPEELRWVASVLGRRGFVGNALSLPSSSKECSSHVIDIPPVESGAPIKQLAKMEVARARKCNPDDFELGFWALPAKGRTQETLAVACPKRVIETTIETFEGAGFELAGIDLMELAIDRGGQASARTAPVENEINASLHIGWNSSLAVLKLGETVIYVRRLEKGAASVWNGAVNKFNMSYQGADAVIDDRYAHDDPDKHTTIQRAIWSTLASEVAYELDVAVAYVSHSFRMAPLGRVLLSGYGNTNPVIQEHIDRVLGIPIEIAAPTPLLQCFDQRPNAPTLAGRLAVAYGLAARFDK